MPDGEPTTQPTSSRPTACAPAPLANWVAYALVFGTSAAVLVLEITSLRLIAPYVGITMETNTSVIGLASPPSRSARGPAARRRIASRLVR